ncbi:MAG: Hsp70 family protein [Thermoguttaceae bacterium]|nr:Hsp70 family protein [Thermoguttaceae bacterium]
MTQPDALYLVGEIASRRAADFPEQTISSAKSWLTCPKVDRRRPILPWNTDVAAKVSPVEASRRYLAHLVEAWNHTFSSDPIFDQQVVLTLPASFDESARELTREAAILAGFNPETLLFLEEPQAALYAWLSEKGDAWRKELSVGDVVFICDVGGGTTDLSMVRVEEENGIFVLNRLAVGNRLLLGGDNIDLTLAYHATELFSRQGIKLNPWQSVALQRQCRSVKETLLRSNDSLDDDSVTISVLGRSSRLVGEAVSVDFPKQDATSIVLDGFFPFCELSDRPKSRSGMGLREVGLPYEVDASITRHAAKFLNSCSQEDGTAVVPTYFLLNGGVFNATLLKGRFREQLEKWFPETSPKDLSPQANLDQAVSCGAAYYGRVKKNGGVRIRAASARSYYIGVESAGLAIPGISRPLKALCVAPFGMEEGTECVVPSEEFELTIGESSLFRFFSSTTRPHDRPGTTLDWYEGDDDSGLQETAPIETKLDDYVDGSETNDAVPSYVTVRFRSVVTELGALEIWCEETNGERSWKLEFSVR